MSIIAADVDGDGIPEIALASEFSNDPAQSPGVLSILKHNRDPKEPWTSTEIDRLPATHRLRWADLDGNGRMRNAHARPDARERIPTAKFFGIVTKRRQKR